jgi:isopentenyl diphosphate isomerase/L-lactate dehydrogenase-like FMN-dependent dehydrogenase
VTIDAPATSNRERDYRNRVTVPMKLSPSLLLRGAASPRWAMDFLRGTVRHGGVDEIAALGELAARINESRPVTREDLSWLRGRWQGPLVVKGVMRGDECAELLELGVDGIVVSNHGGRQLDGVRATIEILPEVVSAVGGQAEVFLDGGVRRGIDVAKALALGARACLVGRPYLYGLAAGGQRGVDRVLEILRVELQKAMAQLGCTTVSDFDQSLVEWR